MPKTARSLKPPSKRLEELEREKRGLKLLNGYVTPQEVADLRLAIISVLVMFLALGLIGCGHRASRPEPVWRPNIYLYSPSEKGECEFVSGDADVIRCNEPRMYDLACAPLEDISAAATKMKQCEVWR